MELIETRVVPYLGDPQQLVIAGPDLQLPADHALALGLGAPRTRGQRGALWGAFHARWKSQRRVEGDAGETPGADRGWRPAGRPPKAPERGFGMELIERGLDKIIDSDVSYTLKPEGAVAKISFPISAET